MNSVAVLVSSCDAFSDAWKPFAFFFRRHWPDCPFPVYLITNELRITSQFVQPIAVGPDRGWASNLKIALEQIRETHLLYFQEDYFLIAPVQTAPLTEDFQYAFENEVDALCFRARENLERDFQPLNDRFGVVPEDSDGRTRLQVTLWKREALATVLRDGENAWEMEARGSERTRGMKMISYSTRENPPISYQMSAIVRGLWTREALEMCASADCEITPQFRGIYSPNKLLQRWRRAQTRRRMATAIAEIKSGGIVIV